MAVSKKKIIIAITALFIVTAVILSAVYKNDILDLIYKNYKAASPEISTYIKAEDDEIINGDFYVSTNGNDSDIGSKDFPFLTIERAIEAVRNTDKTNKNGVFNYVQI